VNDAQTIWIVDAHRGDGKRFVVRADEKLSAFLELEAVNPGAYSSTPLALAKSRMSSAGTQTAIEIRASKFWVLVCSVAHPAHIPKTRASSRNPGQPEEPL
jgi:hypothetical protein